MPRVKRFLSEVKTGQIPRTLWTYSEVGHTQDAKKQLLATVDFGDNAVFSTPKPVQLMERIIRLSTGPDDLVLDFFAGSGTTAHAVHKLNAEDGGRRREIRVSSTAATVDEPDKNICRDVCATRVRRVIEGYGSGEKATLGLGGDFAYLRTRRIEPGRLTDIDHAQVWTALRLTHGRTLRAFTGQPILTADASGDTDKTDKGGGDGDAIGPRLIYVPHYTAKHAPVLLAAVKVCMAGVVYAWQPGLVKKQLAAFDHVSVEPVPESLARRFGLRI